MVSQILPTLPGVYPKVIIALGADLEVTLQLFSVYDLFTGVALDPHSLGNLDRLLITGYLCFFKPCHYLLPPFNLFLIKKIPSH